ncbi:MAG: hypothetical protein KHY53_15205 [Clostridiales bacterium]|uniref:hypothetical protein n=1 Tax=Mediterraneibacter faecis TaxID=592978 RepID=UPI001DCE81D3|nr:hypothetical protein [Clostridiales bacterium]
MVGTGITAAQTIEMTGDKYDLTSGKIQPDTSANASFTVPAGSYSYTINFKITITAQAGAQNYVLMRWSVSEAEVPNGYTVAVAREGNTVVLTNTAKKPGNPDGEVNPPSKKPTGKTTDKIVNKTTDKTSDKLPQTGQLWWPVLVLLFAGAICLLAGRVLRDRKEEKNR